MRPVFIIMALTALVTFLPSLTYGNSRDVTLETPFLPLPDGTSSLKDGPENSISHTSKRNTHFTHERYAKRLKDIQLLEHKGLSSHTAHKAVWAIAHKPQSSCAIYAMHLAGYHDMKFVRPELVGKSEKETDNNLVKELTKLKLCEKSRLNKRLPKALPYVQANSALSIFKTQPELAKKTLIRAGISEKNADDVSWVILHHPESACAWQVERILADERSGDHNSDDEKDAVLKIEHRNECSHAYYK